MGSMRLEFSVSMMDMLLLLLAWLGKLLQPGRAGGATCKDRVKELTKVKKFYLSGGRHSSRSNLRYGATRPGR